METGAVTAPMVKPAPRAPGGPAVPGTAPMVPAGPGGAPKATVKLQQTQPMVRPSVSAPPSAPVKRSAPAESEQFFEEKDPEAGLMPLSVVCLLLSLVLLGVQMLGSDRVTAQDDSPIMVPTLVKAEWETQLDDRTFSNNFSTAKYLPPAPAQ